MEDRLPKRILDFSSAGEGSERRCNPGDPPFYGKIVTMDDFCDLLGRGRPGRGKNMISPWQDEG
jgi:hypothetical protein